MEVLRIEEIPTPAPRPGWVRIRVRAFGLIAPRCSRARVEDIPSAVRLTVYHSRMTSADRSTAALQEIADGVAAGRYRANLQRRFRFDEIVEAHRFMEERRGSGKLVVVVDE